MNEKVISDTRGLVQVGEVLTSSSPMKLGHTHTHTHTHESYLVLHSGFVRLPQLIKRSVKPRQRSLETSHNAIRVVVISVRWEYYQSGGGEGAVGLGGHASKSGFIDV